APRLGRRGCVGPGTPAGRGPVHVTPHSRGGRKQVAPDDQPQRRLDGFYEQFPPPILWDDGLPWHVRGIVLWDRVEGLFVRNGGLWGRDGRLLVRGPGWHVRHWRPREGGRQRGTLGDAFRRQEPQPGAHGNRRPQRRRPAALAGGLARAARGRHRRNAPADRRPFPDGGGADTIRSGEPTTRKGVGPFTGRVAHVPAPRPRRAFQPAVNALRR